MRDFLNCEISLSELNDTINKAVYGYEEKVNNVSDSDEFSSDCTFEEMIEQCAGAEDKIHPEIFY